MTNRLLSSLKFRNNAAQLFGTDDLQGKIGKKTAKGGAYTLGATAINFLVTTSSTILVTRQLTGEDFGLVAMVTVLTGFARIFLDLGLSRAVIQKKDINHEQVSTLFWINLAIATLIALCVAAITPILVWIYNEPRLMPINLALSSLFVVSALGLQHRALLARRMEHGKLTFVSLVATLIAAIISVVIAYLGGKYWALIAMSATSQLIIVIGMWVVCPWIPGRPRRGSGVREMLSFGSRVTGFQFVNYFARNADNALLGYFWGAGPLGLYARTYSLMMMPASKLNGPLTNVVVPALSRVRDDAKKYRQVFLTCLTPLAYFQTILVGFAVLNIDNLVFLFLGENWLEIVPIFYALSLACMTAGTNTVSGWLYLSYGHVDKQLKWSIFQTSVVLLAIGIGLPFGVTGVAWAVSAAIVFNKPLSIIYASRPTPIPSRDVLICVYKPIAIVAIALAAAMIANAFVNQPSGAWTQILLNSGLYLGFGTICVLLTPSVRSDVYGIAKSLQVFK